MSHLVPQELSDEQRSIVRAPRGSRLLVIAGPGTGKTATACARIDYLIGEGDVSPTRVLFISFTRTAVAELRERTLAGAIDETAARAVRISTIDSHAWRLREGYGDGGGPKPLSYDHNLTEAVAMLESGAPDLVSALEELDHLVVDEAQDVGDLRARFLIALIRRLSPQAGVTVLADPHQAIYGSSDEEGSAADAEPVPLLERIRGLKPPFEERELRTIFRTRDPSLLALLRESREHIAVASQDPHASVSGLRETLARYGEDTGKPDLDDLTGREDALVLFHARAPALLASSYLSAALREHRLRMSGLPTIASPWIGVVLSRVEDAYLGRAAFDDVWRAAVPQEALRDVDSGTAWRALFRVAGDAGRLHMPTLSQALARERPPVELCATEVGTRGPVISTIHASKGREADTVRVMLKPPSPGAHDDERAEAFARVLYVAATRARQRLELGKSSHWTTDTLPSGRVISPKDGVFVQIGCAGDVDRYAHLRWPDADTVQKLLANLSLCSMPASAVRRAELEHAYVVSVDHAGETTPIAQLTQRVNQDLFEARKRYSIDGPPPATLLHLTVFGCRTIGIPVDQRDRVARPFAISGIALAPVIKGFIKMARFGGGRHRRAGRGRA
jgi:hypothetical protein